MQFCICRPVSVLLSVKQCSSVLNERTKTKEEGEVLALGTGKMWPFLGAFDELCLHLAIPTSMLCFKAVDILPLILTGLYFMIEP